MSRKSNLRTVPSTRLKHTMTAPSTADIQRRLFRIRAQVLALGQYYESGTDRIDLVRDLHHVHEDVQAVHRALVAHHIARLLNKKGEFIGTRDELLSLVKEMRRL